jgi:hypothetical protein
MAKILSAENRINRLLEIIGEDRLAPESETICKWNCIVIPMI